MGFVSKKRGSLAVRLHTSRKADMTPEMWFFIFMVLMVVGVGVTLFAYERNVVTDLSFEKRFTSIDVGMLTTSVFYAPGTLKHTYVPILFPVPIDIALNENSLVVIEEPGTELKTYYWFFSDQSMDPLTADKQLRLPPLELEEFEEEESAIKRFIKAITSVFEQLPDYPFTYYKTGGRISFSQHDVNPLQLTCPSINTSDPNYKSNQIFLAKVLKDKEDYDNKKLPANRIVQTFKAASAGNLQVTASDQRTIFEEGPKVTAIPKTAKIVIAVGDSGEEREKGSLVIYIPANKNLMKNRKLACFIINDLLTPDTTVFYSQVMPVVVESIEEDSPLSVFKELPDPDNQLMVFINTAPFANLSATQIKYHSIADAIQRAIIRYYGVYGPGRVPGYTFKMAEVSAEPQTQEEQEVEQEPAETPQPEQ
jgi:hypothetical protein